ncbi:hypothetical protein TELCIR_06589 [Teladorsagia circumcincta]|uniref:Surfactant protein B n=1 Tax=Teladorsagia circumcincta TaxID=45464 RepID=A0A2G9UMK9_TELCI|nr:hypothetical protein TELCIR_06589 [Teladorsagia circumcincta]
METKYYRKEGSSIMRTLLLLAIVIVHLFSGSLCYDCKQACTDCINTMHVAKLAIDIGKSEQVKKDMTASFCDPSHKGKKGSECFTNPCNNVDGTIASLKNGKTFKSVCEDNGLC